MIDCNGWKLPIGEKHLQQFLMDPRTEFAGRGTYQRRKYLQAAGHCRNMRTAIDVGGHVGLWSWQMAHDFDFVVAFEPIFEHRKCFNHNLRSELSARRVMLQGCALGAPEQAGKFVSLETGPGSSGDTSIVPGSFSEHDDPAPISSDKVIVRTLDGVFSELPDENRQPVDLIKIDCEGFEFFVLRGAEAIIREYSPVLIIEQKRTFATKYGIGKQDAVLLAIEWGYQVTRKMNGDFVMVRNA